MIKKLLSEKIYEVPVHDWILVAAGLMMMLDICWIIWLAVSAQWLDHSVVFLSTYAVAGNLATVIFLILVGQWAANRLEPVQYTTQDLLFFAGLFLAAGMAAFYTPDSWVIFGMPARILILVGTIMVMTLRGDRKEDPQSK